MRRYRTITPTFLIPNTIPEIEAHTMPTMNYTRIASVLIAGCWIFSTAAQADELELARSKNCTTCHSVEKKIVGPAFRDVAAKYRGQKGIAKTLATKVMKGGGGVWGVMPMPANTQVNEAEATKLVNWVLSQ